MNTDDLKRLKEDRDQAWQEKIAKVSAEAFAFVESRPGVTFRFNFHAKRVNVPPFAAWYSAENPEGEELCELLRTTFPRTRGADTAFTEAFDAFVEVARERDCLIAEPDQRESVIVIRVQGPIAVRKPLTFKKNT